MLQLLLYFLEDQGQLFRLVGNLLDYITFRAAMAAVTSLLLGIFAGPPVIRQLQRMKIGQQIRGDGIPDLYEKHKEKAGTPTMGGILILMAVIVSLFFWGDLSNRLLLMAIFAMLALGGLGMADDWIKLTRKNYKGLTKKQKIIGQVSVGLLIGLMVYLVPLTRDGATELHFPFLKNFALNLGLLYIPFVMLVIVSTSNAVNLTDGLDGLAIGCVVIAALPYGVLAYIIGRTDFSSFLLIEYVPGAGELAVFIAAVAGAGLAFLWYNAHPAQIFMGDTGSLALGGALGTVAVFIKQEMLLPIIGGIFVAEALSVIIQIYAVRRWNRRVFRMAPLHHHFEMKGWHETKIITRFWIISVLLGIFGLATLKMR